MAVRRIAFRSQREVTEDSLPGSARRASHKQQVPHLTGPALKDRFSPNMPDSQSSLTATRNRGAGRVAQYCCPGWRPLKGVVRGEAQAEMILGRRSDCGRTSFCLKKEDHLRLSLPQRRAAWHIRRRFCRLDAVCLDRAHIPHGPSEN